MCGGGYQDGQVLNDLFAKPILETTGTRKNWVDWAKAFGMLMIIYCHCFPKGLEAWLFSFNVALFFFLSGYLTKRDVPIATGLRKIGTMLVVPYLVLSVLKALPEMTTGGNAGWSLLGILLGFNSLHDVMGCGKLWFVFTLIVIKVLFLFFGNKRQGRITMLLICIVGSIIYNQFDSDMSWGLVDVLISMPFFLAGHACREWQPFERLMAAGREASIGWSVAAIIVLTAVTYIVSYFNGWAYLFEAHYGRSIILFAIGATTGIAAVLVMAAKLDKRSSKACRYVSVGSIVTLVYHTDVLHPFTKWIGQQDFSTVVTDGALLAASLLTLLVFIPITMLLSHYLPFIVGGRK